MKSTFSVIYYLKRQVVKKDGTVPVMGRITVDGSQTQFSCKLTVDPKLWDTKGGRVTGRSTAALETNRMLDKMRVRINKHYQEIMERDNFVTAEKVKNAFLGLEHRYHTLLQVFQQHNEDYAMHLVKLGQQFVLKSRQAFSLIKFTGYELAEHTEWFDKKNKRDKSARREYLSTERNRRQRGDIYITQIMDEEMKSDDARLR